MQIIALVASWLVAAGILVISTVGPKPKRFNQK